MYRLSQKLSGERRPVFPSRRTTTSNTSAPFSFLPTNIHSVQRHNSWCSKSTYRTTYWGRLPGTRTIPFGKSNQYQDGACRVLPIHQPMAPKITEIDDVPDRLIDSIFVSSCPPRNTCGSFRPFRPNTSNERPPLPQITTATLETERWQNPETGFLGQFKTLHREMFWLSPGPKSGICRYI